MCLVLIIHYTVVRGTWITEISISGRQEVSVKLYEGIFGKIGMRGLQIQGHFWILVFHHGEPCTFRWTKNTIFGKKTKMM